MSRPLRLSFPNAVYHLTGRGNERRAIFRSDQDRRDFLDVLADVVDHYGWICHGYCLMNNHYHLLVETPRANLSEGMRQLNGVYTQSFNRRYKRVGHLFQGRFKAILIQKERHLLELSRYVAQNPVRVKACRSVADYPWSHFRAAAGLAVAPTWLTVGWIQSAAKSSGPGSRGGYRAFAEEPAVRPWDALQGQVLLGDDDFVHLMRDMIRDASDEVPWSQKRLGRPPLKELLSGDNAVHTAHREHGYTLKEIARELGVHYTTVSRWVNQGKPSA
jgi:REP element-mobilizing transposase RayT